MDQIFVGRQPILSNFETIFGYELLFRNASSLSADVTNNMRATASVMVNTLNDIGFTNLVGAKKGFINVDNATLSSGFVELLPQGNTVLELLEDVEVNDNLIDMCNAFKEKGYVFALDDFTYNESYLPLLDIADYVKLDVLMYKKEDLVDLVKLLKKHPAKLLAEKVETKQAYQYCCELGFEFFQGYFFSKPTTITGKSISPSQMVLLKLFNSLSKEEDVAIVERLFKKNPQLDIKLLKFMNSAAFYLSQKINSIRQAITMLGYRNLQKWVSLMLFAHNTDDIKSNPLLELAAVRGFIMESLANSITKSRAVGESAFIVGILSLTDILLATPLNEIMASLNLSQEIRAALEEREGLLGKLLLIAENLQKEKIGDIKNILEQYNLELNDLLAVETNAIMDFEKIDDKN